MKTLLLLILSTITFTTQAQTSVYHPFPDSDAVWNVSYGSFQGSCYDDEYYSYVMGNDTLIGGFTYHNIFIPSIISHSSNPCNSGGIFIGYQGSIRQDTIARRVYFLQPDSTNEKLLFDFNLNIGDTVQPDSFCWPRPFIINTIDSTLIGNNYRKTWRDGTSNILIEGIGTGHGLLSRPCGFFEAAYGLQCFKQNGTTLYPDSTTACDIISSINNLSEENSLSVFPNPATNLLTITTTSTQPSTIILYDIASRQLMQQKFNGSATLNIEGLAKGVYLYEVRSETGVKQGRVVKE